MGVPIDPEKKARAFELLLQGLLPDQVAGQLGLAPSTVRVWRRNEPGFLERLQRVQEGRRAAEQLAKAERTRPRGEQVVGGSFGVPVTVRAAATHKEKVRAVSAEFMRLININHQEES